MDVEGRGLEKMVFMFREGRGQGVVSVLRAGVLGDGSDLQAGPGAGRGVDVDGRGPEKMVVMLRDGRGQRVYVC